MSCVTVAAALIRENGKILISSRPEGKKQAGKWEFPGGKLESHENIRQCIVREMQEELALSVMPLDIVLDFEHTYSADFTVHLIFIRCKRLSAQEPVSKEKQQFRWVPVRDLPTYDFLEADLPIAELLANAAF